MGVSLEAHRRCIGLFQCHCSACFSSSNVNVSNGLSLKHIPVAVLCLLLLIGGIEPNPGPLYVCKVCLQSFSNLSNYCKHASLHCSSRHSMSAKKFVVPCTYEHCPAKVSSYKSLCNHLARYHAAPKPSSAPLHKDLHPPCPIEGCGVLIISREFYIKHMLGEHLQQEKAFTCIYTDCNSVLKKKGQFSTHMSRYHPGAAPIREPGLDDSQASPTTDDPHCGEGDDSFGTEDNNVEEVNNEQDAFDTNVFPDAAMKDEIALFYLKLEAVHLLPTSVVQTIAEEVKLITELIHGKLKGTLTQELNRLRVPKEEIQNIVRVTFASDPIYNVHHKGEDVEQLGTNHLRVNFWKKRFSFVNPKQIDLGLSEVNKKRYGHLVPIKESVTVLLRNPKVKEAVINSFKIKERSETLEDFTDGSVFHNHRNCQHGGEKCIQLLLFQDAFDPNAFAANTGANKSVGFYFTIGNIPPELRSNLNFIMLAYMILERDLKPSLGDELNDTDRLKEVLEPLLDELKDLKVNGIDIDGESVPVCILFLIGDSLGQNYIGGFVKNFSSSQYWCRFCPMSKENFLKHPYETEPLRTPAQYDSHVQTARQTWLLVRKCSLKAQQKARKQSARRAQKICSRLKAPVKKRCLKDAISKSAHKKLLSVSYRGVKYRPSPFNRQDLRFHVCSAQPPCLAHDLFEGIVRVVLGKIVEHMCEVRGWFDLATLNRRIKLFKCEGSDANDAPVVFKSYEKARGSACEIWNLLRLLPFIIGDLVEDKEDPVWQLYLQLKEICERVCAPKISMHQVAYLKSVIRDYLCNLKELFPSCLTPKHHFLCHYPDLIDVFGPLIRLFTLRFESKHAFFKRVILTCQNYINPTYTMARKYVARFAFDFSSAALSPEIVYDSSSVFSVLSLSQGMASAFPHNFEFQNVEELKSVCVKGTNYRPGYFLILNSTEDSRLILGKIRQILLYHSNGDVLFLFEEKIATNSLNGYYIIEDKLPLCYQLKSHQSLLDHYPLPSYNFRGQKCLSLKHSVTCMDGV